MRALRATIFTFVFLASSLLAIGIQPAKAWSGTIYIRADGSVDPLTAPVQRNGDLYILTDTITSETDGIVVEADNITLDGAGYTVCGGLTYDSKGIYFCERLNVTTKNVEIKNFSYGIYMSECSNMIVTENNITENDWYGISLYGTFDSCIVENSITQNGFRGIIVDESSNDRIVENNISNTVYVNASFTDGIDLNGSSNIEISGNNIDTPEGICISRSTNITIVQNTITSAYNGILNNWSPNNSMIRNNISAGGSGINLLGSDQMSILGNLFAGCGLTVNSSHENVVAENIVNDKPLVYLEDVSDYTVNDAGQVVLVNCSNIRVQRLNLSNTTIGCELFETSNCTIVNNVIVNDTIGVALHGSSSHNLIRQNDIAANDYHGIELHDSSHNSVVANDIAANGYAGIFFYEGCSNNTFYHNNLDDNRFQVSASLGTLEVNVWDGGYLLGGNYWSDYTGVDSFRGLYQNETGSDGIGDTPYVIDEKNSDRYPLMLRYVSLFGDLNLDGIVDMFDALLIASAFGSYPGHPRWNEQADLNGDSTVDIYDVVIVGQNFGRRA